jgi:hypothetical protein
MLLTDREQLGAEDFSSLSRSAVAATFRLPPEGVSLEDVERQLVVQALERCGGNQDARRALARDQSRPGAVSHREVRTRQARVASRRGGAERYSVGTGRC